MRPARRRSSGSPLKATFALVFLVLLAVLCFRGALLYKDSRFGKFDRFNLVLVAKPLAFLSVDLQNHSVAEVKFPGEFYIPELAYGYGAYRVSAIYSVGQLDHRGGETAVETVSDYLGVPVDGYIYDPTGLPGDIKGFFLSPVRFLGAQSNINFLDRVRLALTIVQTRFDKIKVVDLANLAESLVLVDGSSALSLDKESIDNKLQGSFVEGRIRDEALRLEIINSTKVVGLGNRAGRLLGNIGASVISVGSVDARVVSCQIQATSKVLSSVTVARVKAIFACELFPNIEEGRSEVVVTLGQDYVKKLGK